jgi:hypothetical protein
MDQSEVPDRHYQFLVFGVERKGITSPKGPIKTRNFTLCFEPFGTAKRFNDFDSVILFQGIFEYFERENGAYGGHLSHSCEKDELDKRMKEAALLYEKPGFLCFLLSEAFIDVHGGHRFKGSDLAKYHLNYENFHRENYTSRVAHMEVKVDDFRIFLNLYGAASSYFRHYNKEIDCRIIAEFQGEMVSMVMKKRDYFIPTLIPANRPETIEEYFTLLADALVSSRSKLNQVLPDWIDGFAFNEEMGLGKEREAVAARIHDIDMRMDRLKRYKAILALSGQELVDSVIGVFREGFAIAVDGIDNLREDFKLLDSDKKPFVLCEEKSTNRGVKREHVNQADSHRERSGFDAKFSSLLIINTAVKSARSVAEKDQEVAMEQVQHAQGTIKTSRSAWSL